MAVLVFATGVLAVASSSALVAGTLGVAAQQTVAAAAAQSRFDQLHSLPCAMRVSGQDSTRRVLTQWSVEPVTRGVSVTVTVRYDTPRERRTHTYRSILLC